MSRRAKSVKGICMDCKNKKTCEIAKKGLDIAVCTEFDPIKETKT